MAGDGGRMVAGDGSWTVAGDGGIAVAGYLGRQWAKLGRPGPTNGLTVNNTEKT